MSFLLSLRDSEKAARAASQSVQTAFLDATFVLDASGSMSRYKNDVVRAYDRLVVEQQRETAAPMSLTVATFSDACVVGATASLNNAGSLALQGYRPECGGGTALNDAIVETVQSTANRQPSGQVVVVIITDGNENSSVRATADAFTAIAFGHSKGWKFILVGANQDAVKTASRYGIPPENALTFAQRSIGFSRAFRALSQNLTAYRRSQGTLGFTEEQRKEQRLLLNERNP